MKQSDDPINQILRNTAKTEERTRNIEKNLQNLQERYNEESTVQDERIAELETRTERQGMIISGALVTVGGALTAFYNWIAGIF